jgi:hypothetical protein
MNALMFLMFQVIGGLWLITHWGEEDVLLATIFFGLSVLLSRDE